MTQTPLTAELDDFPMLAGIVVLEKRVEGNKDVIVWNFEFR